MPETPPTVGDATVSMVEKVGVDPKIEVENVDFTALYSVIVLD